MTDLANIGAALAILAGGTGILFGLVLAGRAAYGFASGLIRELNRGLK